MSKISSNPKQRNLSSPKTIMSKMPVVVLLEDIKITGRDMKNNWFLRFCSILHGLTVILGLSGAGVQIYNVFRAESISTNSENNMTDLLHQGSFFILRIYCMFLSLLAMFTEREDIFLFKNLFFLDSWTSRGLFLIFCGVLQVITKHYSCQVGPYYAWNDIVGTAFLALGSIYFTLGCLCFNLIRDRQLMKIRKQKQMTLQAEQLHVHKSEVEQMLLETQSKLKMEGLV